MGLGRLIAQAKRPVSVPFYDSMAIIAQKQTRITCALMYLQVFPEADHSWTPKNNRLDMIVGTSTFPSLKTVIKSGKNDSSV